MEGICISKLEMEGPQIIAQFPDNYFTKSEITEVPMKVMPLNAKEGDFVSLIFRENLMIVSYIFTINESSGARPSLLSIAAVLDEMTLNPFVFKEVFKSIISQLKDNGVGDVRLLMKILPTLFKSLTQGQSEITITKTISIRVEMNNLKKDPKKRKKDRSKGMW